MTFFLYNHTCLESVVCLILTLFISSITFLGFPRRKTRRFDPLIMARLHVETCYFNLTLKAETSLNSILVLFSAVARLPWRANMAASPSSEWEDSPCVKSCPPAHSLAFNTNVSVRRVGLYQTCL